MENKQRLKMLKSISHDANLLISGNHSYRDPLWHASSVAIFSATGFVFGLLLNSLPLTVAGVIAGAIIGFILVKPDDPYELIYYQLIEYQPLDLVGYQYLQYLAASDELEPRHMLEWVKSERDLVSPPEINATDMARQRFVAKRNFEAIQ